MARILPILLVSFTLALAACDPPEEDPGPASVPEVKGAMEGTVLYVGQRPECDYALDPATSARKPTAVRGNVILLLFRYDNPPPPSGSATSASNLLILPGREMFELADCMPEAPSAEDLSAVITRSTDFDWPEIELARGAGATVEYQIRSFFDRDADFNPFFSVRRLATKGDVAGGAFVNTAANPPQFERVTFGSLDDDSGRNGQVVSGVAVTLGAYVNTELPASRLGEGTLALRSEATIPTTTDAVQRERLLWEESRMRLSLIDPTVQSWAGDGTADGTPMGTLRAAGMTIDPHPSGYGWFTLPVDADRDGRQDLHPTLGAGGVMWQHPIVILRRARNPLEMAVGIPDVVIIASVRPSQTLGKFTFYPDIDIAVAPVAAVTLDPSRPVACRIPFIPPGNQAEIYERIPVDCQELPTGNYDVNVLAGTTGARAIDYRRQTDQETPGLPPAVIDAIVGGKTDNDWILEGGQFSSQAWSIPNELGCPDPYRPNGRDAAGEPITVSQVDPDPLTNCGPPDARLADCDDTGTNMQCTQGPAGRFSVVDPTPSNTPARDDFTAGHGVAACQTAPSATDGVPRTVRYIPAEDAAEWASCCAPIMHLCGLPACETREAANLANGTVRSIRELQRSDLNEDGTARCVPFLMPVSCCGS